MIPRSPHPGSDLLEATRRALHAEGHLFAAGEVCVLRTVLALGDATRPHDADALELFARLSLRKGPLFRRPDYACATDEALARLVELGLLTTLSTADERLALLTGEELRAACARLGLGRGGRRAELEVRLRGHDLAPPPHWRVGHAVLLDRVDRLGGYDRKLLPAERVVGWTWAEYEPTGGPGLYPDRRRMREHERARAGELTLDEALRLARAGPPPWGPSAHRRALEQVLAASLPADTLATVPGAGLAHVRALEAEGRVPEAVARCRRGDDNPSVALALARTGHRLARATRLPWPPVPPLRAAPTRRLRLDRVGTLPGGRPAWRGADDAPVVVEAAVVAALAGAGREAVHAENWLWSSLFALAFRSLYWLPVAGRLPTRRRTGPVDLGSPAFYAARQDAAERVLGVLATEGIAPLANSYGGEVLWGLSRVEESLRVGLQLPGNVLCTVLGTMLRRGMEVSSGLPDLVVLPGPAVNLPGALPSFLPGGAFLVEVKGPGDQLREGQSLWIDRCMDGGIRVELWEVR